MKLFEERPVFSVSQIVNSVKFQLETKFHDIWIQGEVSNFKKPPSGHLYFTLKDSDAQIRAVCFRMQNQYLRFKPEDGMDIVARGAISVYPPRGEFQLVVEFMEPVGKGALQVAFEQLKAQLEKEGLFEAARKKKLPMLPSKIGVVTSPTGAAIQDILRVLKRRNDRIHVLIFPVKVQGTGAAQEIARALHYFNQRFDVDTIIVGRGGGSWEDLWAFNEETVARAIHESRIPVISAVGHEIDFTIADFVADLRAPTPSAAAEIVAAVHEELCNRVEHLARRAHQSIRLILHEKRRRLQHLAANRAFVDAESKLNFFLQRLDELYARLIKTLPRGIQPRRERLTQVEKGLDQQMRFYLQQKKQLMNARQHQLQAYSPLAVLERGYAIVTSNGAQVVRDPAQVVPGGQIDIRVARGSFRAIRK
ncbi:MAG: exodeoxyribonuclease VII large subunit [Acidobacteriota bacterium]